MVANGRNEHSMVKKRTEVVFLLFMAAALVLALRLGYLQWAQAPGFAALADRMQGRTLEIDARRGSITDRNGYELATDVLGKAVCVNPRLVRSPERTVARLAALLRAEPDESRAALARLRKAVELRRYYCRLFRGIDRQLAERAMEEAKTDDALRGAWLEDSPKRVNPGGRDGLQIIGEVSSDRAGITGIELRLDEVLRGTRGERTVRVDGRGVPIPDSGTLLRAPVDGRDVRLTLDRDVQHFVEIELEKTAVERKPDAATAIVLDVPTGDVLAMASWPSYHGAQKRATDAQRRNRAVTDLFEPGSTFKVVTAAAALEAGLHPHLYCPGARGIGKYTINCAHGRRHGALDLRKMIEVSCNLAAGATAEKVGPERLYEFFTKVGLQEKTGIEFPGEEFGRLPRPDEWKTLRTVNIGFGQGIVVTPLQLAAAYAAIGNGGIYRPPRLVLEAPGAELPPRTPRRVMREEAAAELLDYMEDVVVGAHGTGKNAKIPGFSVAGKTGTAQIAVGGRYGGGYAASFVGLLPARKPKLAILVTVWHPRVGQYGGTVAAPVFREIARQTVACLDIPQDSPRDLRDGADPGSFYRLARGRGAERATD